MHFRAEDDELLGCYGTPARKVKKIFFECTVKSFEEMDCVQG